MQTKLTLSIEEKVIEKAKSYAKQNGKSLSRLVEDYLIHISANDALSERDIPPLTARLAGILKGKRVLNMKDEMSRYVDKKYK